MEVFKTGWGAFVLVIIVVVIVVVVMGTEARAKYGSGSLNDIIAYHFGSCGIF